VRATTVFNKIVAPLRVTVTDVVFEGDILVLSIRAARRRLRCVCGWSTPSSYDSSRRRWRHLDIAGTKVFLEAPVRRLACGACQRVVTEDVDWARHGARHTRLFDNVVAWWCQRADRTSVAEFWRCDWATVTAIAGRVVADNLGDGRFEGLTRIGVDEISWSKGHRYVTVVVDQTSGNVIWVGDGKNAEVLGEFYTLLGVDRCAPPDRGVNGHGPGVRRGHPGAYHGHHLLGSFPCGEAVEQSGHRYRAVVETDAGCPGHDHTRGDRSALGDAQETERPDPTACALTPSASAIPAHVTPLRRARPTWLNSSSSTRACNWRTASRADSGSASRTATKSRSSSRLDIPALSQTPEPAEQARPASTVGATEPCPPRQNAS
jgi:hypothetical protein